ncbi:hypothetical protein MBRU_13275 [Mycolicibacterium brumae DSM 44177]|nr:hypothetical protein MBRU_13275 [Mycolicibacterium brumae DSM 44177]
MMYAMGSDSADISRMPRGGPDASFLDRLLQTGLSEYSDRDDADPNLRKAAIEGQEQVDKIMQHHQPMVKLILEAVADKPDPAILELGAGTGLMSRMLLEQHPSMRLTVSDVDPARVSELIESLLGKHSRVTISHLDATRIDAPDGAFDLAVFAYGLHHLSAVQAAQMLVEGTRVASELLVVDVSRPPSPVHLVRLATLAPFAPVVPFVHDAMISSLRAYSASAIRAIAADAGDRCGEPIAVSVAKVGPDLLVRARRATPPEPTDTTTVPEA